MSDAHGFPAPVPPPVAPEERPAPVAWSWRRRRWLLSLALALLVIPVILAAFIRVPYFLISPGEARGVAQLIHVNSGTQVFEPKGQILFTTVSLTGKPNVYDALRGWLADNVEVVPATQI